MFLAALTSRSRTDPHSQVHSLMLSGSFDFTLPQSEHVLDDGKNLSQTWNSRPYHPALYSNIVRNSRHPCSEILRDRQRFFIIPFVFKSSIPITWFSLTSLVDRLWRKSLRAFEIFSWTRATLIRALFLFFDPFFLRERLRWAFASFLR